VSTLATILDYSLSLFERVLADYDAQFAVEEIGVVTQVGSGTARVRGLPGVQSEELVQFPNGLLGMAFDLTDDVGVILLGNAEALEAGDEARRTRRVADVPVGDALLGRVVDPIGRPLDKRGPVRAVGRLPVERPAPAIMDRAPVDEPLQTGIKAVDALVPVGRGQRELIIGDRQTGKTAIALDAVLNQHDKDVICVYCLIGQQKATVSKLVADLRERGALAYTSVVVATGERAPGLQFLAPYAATAIAEFFMERGEDVLIIYDDLTHHARAYRELSLLLRRPPGREAYPGDIFYIHSRLLERATRLDEEHGGGSLTALPIIETQAQNISAYIPTNLVSITDGQIYLSPNLFRKGILPAVDIGRSVSRVGGKAQLPAYRAVAGELRLAYSQFEELEAFLRLGTRLDEETERQIRRGRRVREILKQPQYELLPVAAQIAVLLGVTEGVFDTLPRDQVSEAAARVRQVIGKRLPNIYQAIQQGEPLDDETRGRMVDTIRNLVQAGNIHNAAA
jgi:F-type H+-transporting ATPase subunit alpha